MCIDAGTQRYKVGTETPRLLGRKLPWSEASADQRGSLFLTAEEQS